MTKIDSCEQYIRLFEDLSEERINGIEQFVSIDIKFKDPFNDISGLDAFRRLLVKLIDDVKGLRFEVTYRAWSEDVLFLRWTFQGKVKGIDYWKVQGMSEIVFDEQGLVCQHIDHWDASEQFFEKLPLIGTILRVIKRRLKVS
jgi:steroid Delta-isomerase|tara:strand:- start:349 stop:777 length:429 start_codon:yes stop_codon:yes gene_type:complete